MTETETKIKGNVNSKVSRLAAGDAAAEADDEALGLAVGDAGDEADDKALGSAYGETARETNGKASEPIESGEVYGKADGETR